MLGFVFDVDEEILVFAAIALAASSKRETPSYREVLMVVVFPAKPLLLEVNDEPAFAGKRLLVRLEVGVFGLDMLRNQDC